MMTTTPIMQNIMKREKKIPRGKSINHINGKETAWQKKKAKRLKTNRTRKMDN